METMIKTIAARAAVKKDKKMPLRRYAFDNSAKFYPIIASKKAQSLFAVGAIMKENVDPVLLKRALNEIMARFPSLAVKIKRGYSWHYLEQNDAEVELFKAGARILSPIDPKLTNGYMFRVSYSGARIRIDMFHGLCDGTAAMRFLKALIYRYAELCGKHMSRDNDVMKLSEKPTEAETEDSFLNYYKPIKLNEIDLKTLKGGVPLRIEGTPIGASGYVNVEGSASVADIKRLSREKGVSLTAYICGVLAYTIEDIAKSKHPIVMMIPVNLRSVFPSVTMRNFVTFVRLSVSPKQCKNLDDYIRESAKQLKEKSSKENMRRFVCTTVRAQDNFIMKIVPLWLKTLLVNAGRAILRSRQTIIFSNVGVLDMPKEAGVDKFTLNMNVSKFNPQNLGAVTNGDRISFNFTRAIEENVLSKAFFNNLEKLGIKVEK